MSQRLDCSMMSHPACLAALEPEAEAAAPEPVSAEPDRYDCVNECLGQLGLPTAVSGAAVAVGCVIVSAGACAALAGGALGALLGACDAGCEQLAEARE